MSFLDNLTSSVAQQQARDIKASLSKTNLANIQSFFELVYNNLDLLTYTEIADTTLSRNRYEVNRLVRKRNGIYKAIRDMNAKFKDSSEFFLNFTSTDPELTEAIAGVQSVMNSLNAIYKVKKYASKEHVSVERGVGLANNNAAQIRSLIESFSAYFTGGST